MIFVRDGGVSYVNCRIVGHDLLIKELVKLPFVIFRKENVMMRKLTVRSLHTKQEHKSRTGWLNPLYFLPLKPGNIGGVQRLQVGFVGISIGYHDIGFVMMSLLICNTRNGSFLSSNRLHIRSHRV